MARTIVAERSFENLLSSENFGVFFLNQICDFGWRSLLHTEGSFYIPSLVEKFYSSFDSDNIGEENESIYLTWNNELHVIDIHIISELIGIEVKLGDQQPGRLEEYLHIMGPNCDISDGGIKAGTTFKNILATGRWLHCNVLGTSHLTSFYTPALHIIHSLMTNNQAFCMCRQLLKTIIDARLRSRRSYPLPVLVTILCRHIMGFHAFSAYMSSHQHEVTYIATEGISRAYRTCVDACWSPHYQQEDIPVQSESSSDEEYTLHSLHTQMRELRLGQQEIVRRMDDLAEQGERIENKLDQFMSSFSGGSSSVGPSRRHR